jgi:uncharacterized membrane protein YhiD involved in acid resistance
MCGGTLLASSWLSACQQGGMSNLKSYQQQPRRPRAALNRLAEAALSVLFVFCSLTFLSALSEGAAAAARLDAVAAATQPEQPPSGGSLFEQLLGAQPAASQVTHVLEALLSFALAAVLAALLAFRPHKKLSLFRRDPFLVQTQILLAVVGAALMIVVADSAARAFGIFAAAALIRFRTNISNPKEITVLLVSLAVGLAAGVGRWEIAVALTLFVLLLLWPLERFELRQVFRAMELEVKTRNFTRTDAVLKKIFKRHRISAELREADAQSDKAAAGVILYFLNLSSGLSTDQLSEEIFRADAQDIESVKWEQKNSRSYIYR